MTDQSLIQAVSIDYSCEDRKQVKKLRDDIGAIG
jgi:hypothetical protein